MAWVRIDTDLPMDGRLAASGHAWAWPAVVCRAKNGEGYIAARELSPRVMAHLWGPSVEAWEFALSHFAGEGLLVVDGEGYRVAAWADYQRDPTGAERQRRHREARSVTPEPVTVTPATVTQRDVTARNATSRDVTPDSTVRDVTVQDVTRAADAARSRATASTVLDGLPGVLERWRLSLRGRSGAAPIAVGALDVDALQVAVAERGAEYVTRCIDRAAEVAGGGGPSLALLRRIVAEGVHDATRAPQRPRAGKGAPQGAQVNHQFAAGIEASARAGGARMVLVPGEGYVAEDALTDAQRDSIAAAGGMVF